MFALIGRPLLRRMRAEPALSAVFIIVVLITATAAAAIPMIMNRVGDQGMFEALDRAPIIQRGIQVELDHRLPAPEDDPLEPVASAGDRYRAGLPEALRGIIHDTQWTVDSGRFNYLLDDLSVQSGPVQRFFQFRYQSDLEEQTELVEGREPQPAEPISLSEVSDLPETIEDETVPRYEVKIGQGTAEIMELGVGSHFVMRADRGDLRNRTAPPAYFQQYYVVEVVGIFEALEPESEFWFMDTRTFRTDVFTSPDESIYYSMGIPSEDVFPELLANNEPAGHWRYNWRYFVQPGAVAFADAGPIASELNSLVQNLGPFQELSDLDAALAARQMQVWSYLPPLITRVQDQYGLTSAVLSLVVAGILTVGAALAGLIGALVATRRTPEIALMRSRGASAGQLGLSQIVEGALLAIPAALIGILLASLITGRSPGLTSILAALAVGVLSVVVLWALTRRIRQVDLGSLLGRRAGVPGGSSQRRLVVEALIVGMAVAGILLLRQRGVTTGAEDQGVDPYVAAVPVLTGLATGIIAIRLFPLIVRQLARFAGRYPGIVPFFGLRRIADPSLGRHLPLVVMILALAMAVFAGGIWHSIETPEPIPLEDLSAEEVEELTNRRAGVNEAFQAGITQGFWVTIFMAGIYAALAIVCALALTADERRRDLGYLRTMGATRNESLGLTLIEQLPSALLAGVVGAGLGALLTWLIAPGLDIASLYPPDEPVVIEVNWLLAVGQALGLIAIAGIAAGLFAWFARRSDLSDVLRAGE